MRQPSTKLMATPPKPTKSETRAAITVRENKSRLTDIGAEERDVTAAIDAEKVQIKLEQTQNRVRLAANEEVNRVFFVLPLRYKSRESLGMEAAFARVDIGLETVASTPKWMTLGGASLKPFKRAWRG